MASGVEALTRQVRQLRGACRWCAPSPNSGCQRRARRRHPRLTTPPQPSSGATPPAAAPGRATGQAPPRRRARAPRPRRGRLRGLSAEVERRLQALRPMEAAATQRAVSAAALWRPIVGRASRSRPLRPARLAGCQEGDQAQALPPRRAVRRDGARSDEAARGRRRRRRRRRRRGRSAGQVSAGLPRRRGRGVERPPSLPRPPMRRCAGRGGQPRGGDRRGWRSRASPRW